jgi:Zn-dependent protease with chaperone function
MISIDELRCIDDNIQEYEDVLVRAENNAHEYRMQLLSNSLKVTSEITPRIYSVIERILYHLSLVDINLECYVNNDSNMNASCFSLQDSVIIIISSGLVNKMTENELAFVIGH